MLGWIRSHPYLLVRNSLCGKRKQLEAVLNHNYWKLYLYPWGSNFCAKVFSLCWRQGSCRKASEKKGRAVRVLALSTKLHQSPTTWGKKLPFWGWWSQPSQGSRRKVDRFENGQVYFQNHVYHFFPLKFPKSKKKAKKKNLFVLEVQRWLGWWKQVQLFF